MQLTQNQKKICEYFFAICKFRFNFKHFPKKMALLAHVFSNLPTPKEVLG